MMGKLNLASGTLTHELAFCRRVCLGKASVVPAGEQSMLFEEAIEMKMAAIHESGWSRRTPTLN